MAKLDRRHFLRTAAPAAAAAVAIPTAAFAVGSNPTPSPELHEWRDARRLYWEAAEASRAAGRSFAKAYVANHPSRGVYEAHLPASRRIENRIVRGGAARPRDYDERAAVHRRAIS